MWYWHEMSVWGWTMMAAFWALIVLLIVWAIRPSTVPSPREEAPLRILGERLAAGEIDPDEYDDRRAALVENQR